MKLQAVVFVPNGIGKILKKPLVAHLLFSDIYPSAPLNCNPPILTPFLDRYDEC